MSRLPPVPIFPYFLLGALTLVCFGGPFLVLAVVQGGQSARWPPDRAIEWIAIGLVLGLFIVLFTACVTIHLWYSRGRSKRPSVVRDADIDVGSSQSQQPSDKF